MMRSLTRFLVAGTLAVLSAPAMAGDRLADMAFTRLDANGDGQLDAAELQQARERRFERLDVNGDRVITAAEQAEAGSRMFRKAEALEGAMAVRFETLDTDRDGRLTQEEFLHPSSGNPVTRADKDGDGRISKAEFQAAIEAARSLL